MSRKPLSIFEFEKLPVTETGDGIRAHELDALLAFNDAHRGQYFEVGRKHLRAKNFVGYIEVGKLAIEILPKADREAPQSAATWRDGLIEMLRVALGLRLDQHPSASQDVTRSRLLDLIAQAYLAEVEPLLRQGLAKGYRTEQSNGAVFRGRLKISEHLRENVARADRFFVEYPTFDHDITVNRLLAAALHALSWCALTPSIAGRVEECLARFPELDIAGVTAALFDRIRLTRATQRYASALVYARMILAQQGPQLRAGRDRVFALLFNMNTLWERYIAVLLRRAAPAGIRVQAQEHLDFWTPSGHTVRPVKPDIVVRVDATDAALLAIDTKWKVPSNGLPSDDDLKQMFVYNELLSAPRSVLLYPRTADSFAVGGGYATKQHTCAQRHLDPFEDDRWSTVSIRRQLAAMLSSEC